MRGGCLRSLTPSGRPGASGKRREAEKEEDAQTFQILFLKLPTSHVLFSDKFKQSKVYMLKVPQLQFIDDFWTFLLCNRDRCVVDGTENCGRSAVAFYRKPSTSLSCCRG